METADIDALNFEERLGLLVDREMTERENRRLKTRLRKAKLRQNASIEDVDYRHPKGLDRTLISKLSDCQWTGSITTWLSQVPREPERPSLPVHWPKKHVGKDIPLIISASTGCSETCISPKAMDDTRNCSDPMQTQICWSSMIMAWPS